MSEASQMSIVRFVMNVILAILALISPAHAEVPFSVAFYYAADPPWEMLQSYDLVVVDPDHVPNPSEVRLPHTRLAAYVSLGEVNPGRAYAQKIPASWFAGSNADWNSRIIDQTIPEWTQFFINEVIFPLWAAGYRDFFLDTLDSYQIIAKDDSERARQEAGLIRTIRALKARFPGARLIFNRGFEILPQVHREAYAVVAESLYRSYDTANRTYREVSPSDRDWLLAQLNRVKDEYKLPVIVIDYLPPKERDLARETARQIAAHGFIPWVTTVELDSLGVGAIEVMPRRILAIREPLGDDIVAQRLHPAVRLASMPLQYLGYDVTYADPDLLPTKRLTGQVAGILIWLTQSLDGKQKERLLNWLVQQNKEGIPIAIVGDLGFLLDSSVAETLGLKGGRQLAKKELPRIIKQTQMVGLEYTPRPHPSTFFPLTAKEGDAQLVIELEGQRQEAVVLTPWGGYAMNPYVVINLPGSEERRWIIDPFSFFQKALRLPAIPVPDVTTESGRRMLLIHMDGDGFVSRAELPGRPYAGEVLRDRIVRRYRLPMTISVIEGEVSTTGVYPQDAPKAEQVAREIFKEPHVEIASHSYSHPFVWHKMISDTEHDAPDSTYRLPIPGYRFDPQREIMGSIHYIEERLAPPGKKVALFQWTGDCIPDGNSLRLVGELGIPNLNGGDTTATYSQPTLTRVDGIGMNWENGFQVFAPNQNENVYTFNWTKAFYNYRRVIETFEWTEQPRRLKPINIYFHTYLMTKPEGLKALEEVFNWALKQETTPVKTSEYARKVLDFNKIAIARTLDGAVFRIRGSIALRTLRMPRALGFPDLLASRNVGGYTSNDHDHYIHLTDDQAELAVTATAARIPRLVSANGFIRSAYYDNQVARWHLAGYVPLSFSLAHVDGCKIIVNNQPIVAKRRRGEIADFQVPHASATIEALCRT